MDFDASEVGKLSTRIKYVAILLTIAIAFSGAVPPVAVAVNKYGLNLVNSGYSTIARGLFGYLSWFGDANAINNLGVLHLRGLGGQRNRMRAIELFEQAILADHTVAKYNRVQTMPDRYDTPLPNVRRQISLLNENVAIGDIHSGVLLAERLYFVNRSNVVPNREARTLEVLEAAAKSGDREYIYMYGNELWDQGRGERQDGYLIARAVPILIEALKAGEPRAAELLGRMRRYELPWYNKSEMRELYAKDAYAWSKIAADMGIITAKCSIALTEFRWLTYLPASDNATETAAVKATKNRDTALQYLRECALAESLGLTSQPPFGSPALYAYKESGGYIALVNSPGWANLYLGQIYAGGLGVERDVVMARKYFMLAWKKDQFKQAKEFLERLK